MPAILTVFLRMAAHHKNAEGEQLPILRILDRLGICK